MLIFLSSKFFLLLKKVEEVSMISLQDIFILIAISFPTVGKYQREFVEKPQFRYNHSTVLFYHKLCCICAISMLFPLPELSSFLTIQSILLLNLDSPFTKSSPILLQEISISSFCFPVLHCTSHRSLFTYCLALWLIVSYIFLRDLFSLIVCWLHCRTAHFHVCYLRSGHINCCHC